MMNSAEETAKPRPIIVLGAERSGTSVVAEMVSRWGAYAGEPEKLRKADEHNRQGYWEYTPIWDFLVELGTNWWDAGFQQQIVEKASMPHYRDRALELIAGMETEGRPWVWKDPALSFYLPFWKAMWGDAVYIIAVRNPYDTAASWQKFVLRPEVEGSVRLVAGNMLRWHYIMLLILAHTEETGRKIFISYEGLVREPRTHAKRLSEFLSRNCEGKGADDTRIDEMAQAVNPGLWHNQSRIPFDEVPEATDELKALYRFAQRKVQDPFAKFEVGKYPMYGGWREVVENAEALVRFLNREQKAPVVKEGEE